MILAEEQLDMNRHINTAREEGGDAEKEGRKQRGEEKIKTWKRVGVDNYFNNSVFLI